MCIGFAGPRNFNRHSYFRYRFFQKLYDLRFGCCTVESCYYSLTLILVSMCSPCFVTSVFVFFVHVKDFLFHFRDSFTGLLVSVVFFLFSFSQLLSSSLELCSTESVISAKLFHLFVGFSLSKFVHLIFSVRRLSLFLRASRLHLVSSVCLHTFPPTSFFFSLSSSDSSVSIKLTLFHSSQQSQGHFNRSFCSNVVFF